MEVAHAGQIFNGTEEDITNTLNINGFDHVAKSRFDNFISKKILIYSYVNLKKDLN